MRRAALAALLVPLLAACGSARSAGSESAATGFFAAVHAHDGAKACALLAPNTRQALEENEKKPCSSAVTSTDLPAAGTALRAQVYGQESMVAMDHDTVFLSRFREGWRVVAAGCKPRSGEPYDCTVKGN